MVADDRRDYRVALVEAFSGWGIAPSAHDEDLDAQGRSLSADTLRWPGFSGRSIARKNRDQVMECYREVVARLKRFADESLYLTDRKELFTCTRAHREALHEELKDAFKLDGGFVRS